MGRDDQRTCVRDFLAWWEDGRVWSYIAEPDDVESPDALLARADTWQRPTTVQGYIIEDIQRALDEAAPQRRRCTCCCHFRRRAVWS
jgi:hypothetical protein